MKTRELILKNALSMFAESGFDSVSIRDIAMSVNIKESSIYYHFKNKQDILDSLVMKYENHIHELISILQTSMEDINDSFAISFDGMYQYQFDQYLFDPFCNQMMRLMLIEQFHNEKMRKLYEYYMFELPQQIQMNAFLLLAKKGVVSNQEAISLGNDYFATMTMLNFRYLLTGELTQEKKDAFREEATAYMNRVFGGIVQ